MKNFILGFLVCLCLVFTTVQVYENFCPNARLKRDLHIHNSFLLPYDGFALKPLNTGPIFPHNDFPLLLNEEQNEDIQ